jgi:hypothetical protein
MLKQKLKAGALQLTLFIAVIVALLLTAFILLVHTNKRFGIQTDFVIETVTHVNKGINYSLINSTKLKDTVTVNLNDEEYKTLKVHRAFWGVFEKVTSIARIKTNTLKKVALIGAVQQKVKRTALYLQDNNKPLVLVGDTKIEGLAYLPRQGVKPGTISGESYYGSQLIYGTSKTSSQLPKLSKNWLQYVKDIANLTKQFSQDQFLDEFLGLKQSNSFLNETKLLYSVGDIVLNNYSLTGNIVIQSKSKITIEATSKLKDVILIAPEIIIQARVKGNFQAFASKHLIVNEYVELNYPTSLVVLEAQKVSTLGNRNGLDDSNLIIAKNSIINGVVIYIGQPKQSNFKSQIVLEENSILNGELYCNQNFELKGSVYGGVFTDNFIANQSGSTYQNHIYNGRISIDKLPQEYVGLAFENSKKNIAQWLY